VKSAGIGAAAAALRGIDGALAQDSARTVASVKALVFDTFGTVVDWRGSIVEEGNAWGKTKGITVDWARLADRWRAGYAPSMDQVRKGEMPWTNLDHLHRALLEDLLQEFHIEGLSEEEKDHWNRVWHRLKPWPDSVAGLARLKKKYTIAPLSNGNVALARHYKPDREAYLTAVSLLELKPEKVMMCAAHSADLKSARSFGLRTGFIHRPNEYGPARKADDAKPGDFDVVSTDIVDLATKLGA
jgi:2-haloacid dehalogenase